MTITFMILVAVAVASAPCMEVEINKDFIQNGKVLVKGSPIDGANGLAFDTRDRLHIASVLGREIVVMDPRNGKILDRLGPAVGVETPDDIAFGPMGSVYQDDIFWTAIFTGEVGRLSPDGTKITAGQVLPGVNPITFSDDNRLFVAHDFFGNAGLYEIDPDGIDLPTLLDPNFYNLNAFDFGPDGLLYGPIFQERILRIDVDSGPYPLWSEDIINPFASAAVKFNSEGRLFALNGEQVVEIDPATGAFEVVAPHVGRGLDNLAFDSRGRMYVSSFVDGAIYRILPSGKARTISEGGMIAPGGVAVLPRGHGRESLVVGDTFSFRKFDARTGRPGAVEEVFGTASTVAPIGDDIVSASWFNSAIEIRDGETLELIDGPHLFDLPLNAIGFQGDVAVAELGSGSVVRGDHTPIATGLFVPTGLASTESDLWVADWASGFVFQIVDDGIPVFIPVASGLVQPEGMTVNTDGSLLVVETGAGRLTRIDLDTNEVTVIVEGLEIGSPGPPGYPPTWSFSGVAVSPSGHIFVTAEGSNLLYRFKQHPRHH